MATITAACNFYNEINALPGWLEMASALFDDILFIHAGPGGRKSDDGSIELIEKWGARILFDKIDDGFGVIRTKLIREAKTDYVAILDADERLYSWAPAIECQGTPTPDDVVDTILAQYGTPVHQPYDTGKDKRPSNFENLYRLGDQLTVNQVGIIDQRQHLRQIMDQSQPDVIVSIRRHWHDFGFRRPTQSWATRPDYQWRIVRCKPEIGFNANIRMHESLEGWNKDRIYLPHPSYGPFIDHYHIKFKMMEPQQRMEDVRIYNAIAKGEAP